MKKRFVMSFLLEAFRLNGKKKSMYFTKIRPSKVKGLTW